MMRKYLLLLSFLIFSFCGCDSVKRIVPVDDQISQAEEETTDSENREQPDREIVPVEENGDQDEGEPVSNDDLTEKPDSDESPSDDEPAEKPDAGEPENNDTDSDPGFQTPDEDAETENPGPVCGEVFNGSDCAASSCETVEDCCEADLCVATDGCGGAKVCRNAFFKENFDSYPTDSFPDGVWTLKYDGWGSRYQIVTSNYSVSPENSMQLLGKSSWMATMTAVLPQVPPVINVELKMNTEGDDVYFALCTFENEGRNNWGNYDVKVIFVDGRITYQIPEWKAYGIADSYNPNEWYKIRLKLDQVNKTVSVWLNDELKVDSREADFDSLPIPNICLASNKQSKKVWFDDIFVWGE